MYVYICIYVYIYMRVYMCLYLCIYMHTHTHTYTYIYIYIAQSARLVFDSWGGEGIRKGFILCPRARIETHITLIRIRKCFDLSISYDFRFYSVRASISLSIYLSICFNLLISIYLSIYLSISICSYLSIYLSIVQSAGL